MDSNVRCPVDPARSCRSSRREGGRSRGNGSGSEMAKPHVDNDGRFLQVYIQLARKAVAADYQTCRERFLQGQPESKRRNHYKQRCDRGDRARLGGGRGGQRSSTNSGSVWCSIHLRLAQPPATIGSFVTLSAPSLPPHTTHPTDLLHQFPVAPLACHPFPLHLPFPVPSRRQGGS